MTPSHKAKKVFESYADGKGCETPMQLLQVKLAAWQNRNFGPPQSALLALGVGEEAGELFRAILKSEQGIRSFNSAGELLDKGGDAIADCVIYAIQWCTLHRMDYETLLHETAEYVMTRDWVAYPETGFPVPAEVADARCSACGSVTGESYYSDVPGKGLLCLSCHEKWLRSSTACTCTTRFKCSNCRVPTERL